eukprot:Nk52_evm4s239 gene=Nk52_evmTU4s239
MGNVFNKSAKDSEEMEAALAAEKRAKDALVPENIRLCVLGNRGTGKSCWIMKSAKNMFDFSHQPTQLVQCETFTQLCGPAELLPVTMEMWEMPYQDVEGVSDQLLEKADCFVVIANFGDDSSLDFAENCSHELHEKYASKSIPFVLVVTKMDMMQVSDGNVVDKMKRFASASAFHRCFFVSSKHGDNIRDTLHSIIQYTLNLNENFEPKIRTAALAKSRMRTDSSPTTKANLDGQEESNIDQDELQSSLSSEIQDNASPS